MRGRVNGLNCILIIDIYVKTDTIIQIELDPKKIIKNTDSREIKKNRENSIYKFENNQDYNDQYFEIFNYKYKDNLRN